MKRTCKQCGREFYIAQSEVSFYKEKNLQLPKRCKECRESNKRQKAGSGEMDGPWKETAEAGAGRKPGKGDMEQDVSSRKDGGKKAESDAIPWSGRSGRAESDVLPRKEGTGKAESDAMPRNGGSGKAESDAMLRNGGRGKTESAVPQQSAERGKAGWDVPEQDAEKGIGGKGVSGQKPDMGAAGNRVSAQKPGRGDAVQGKEPAGRKSGFKVKLISAAAVLVMLLAGRTVPGMVDNSVPAESTAVSYDTSGLTFRNSKNLEEHYQKHGIEMGFSSAEEYQAAAAAVVGNAEALHKTEAEDGDDVYYIESTNEFVIVSTDGYIRTYFYPDAGIDYYNRQ